MFNDSNVTLQDDYYISDESFLDDFPSTTLDELFDNNNRLSSLITWTPIANVPKLAPPVNGVDEYELIKLLIETGLWEAMDQANKRVEYLYNWILKNNYDQQRPLVIYIECAWVNNEVPGNYQF